MEGILSKLLVPDSEVIRQGSTELKQALKSQTALGELCGVLSNSGDVQIRQYAALLLRKKFSKGKVWAKVSEKEEIKAGLLKSLVNEPEKPVKHSIAQLIAAIAKHELSNNGWQDLLQFLGGTMSNSNSAVRQLGTYTFSVLCSSAGEEITKGFNKFVPVLSSCLQDETDRTSGFYATVGLTHLVLHIGSDEMKSFQKLVSHVIILIKSLIAAGDERACEAMEIFDELFESEVQLVVPNIKPIVELCVAVAAETKLDDPVRVRAITFLGRLVRLKKKTIVKQKFYLKIVEVLFPIMCVGSADLDGSDNEDEEDEPLDQESNSPSICACQTLDVLAMNLPPEKFMPTLLSHVQPAVASNNPHRLKGAFYALAVCAEGCSEHIRSNYMVQFLQLIAGEHGIKHESQLVRNAALYALGQFSEFLQPDITNYVNEILPVLFSYLDIACAQMKAGKKKVPGLDRIFYALEIFSESLEEKLTPFLPALFERLIVMMGSEFSLHVNQLAISEIGSAANAVKEGIEPYFDGIMACLKPYLSLEHADEDQILLKQSMDTLGALARAVGPTTFGASIAEDCWKFAIDLCSKYDDPDIRKCAYSLYASVAVVAKEAMAPVLPLIIPTMLRSVSSKEGISLEYKEDDSGLPVEEFSDDDEDEISLGQGDDAADEITDVKTINVENSFMEEKEQAILALKGICIDTGNAFYPVLYSCYEEVWKLMDFPEEDVRRACVDAVAEFTIASYYAKQSDPRYEEVFQLIANGVVPKLCDMVKEDEEVNVVCVCLEMLTEMLKRCKGGIIVKPEYPQMIGACVLRVMKSECACMDCDEVDSDGDEAEQDRVLFEYAGEILPSLGMAMNPSSFSPLFNGLFSFLAEKTKKRALAEERSFAIGSLAECMEPLHGMLDPYLPCLKDLFISLHMDENKDVRNNAVFGLGELALHGGQSVHQFFPQILGVLSNQLSQERDPRCIDQIVGAVCRLIIANKQLVPLNDVLPVLFNNLPLREDYEEYDFVYRCLQSLYSDGNEIVKENLKKIVEISIHVYDKKEVNKELVGGLVKRFSNDFPQHFSEVLTKLPTETASIIGYLST